MMLLTMSTSHADVIVTLRSGIELRATRTWTEGDTLKAQLRTGVVGIPSDTVVSVREMTDAERAAALVAPPPKRAAAPSAAPADAPAPQVAHGKGDAAKSDAQPAAESPPAAAEEHIPDVPGEDAVAKMERLDKLSIKTHRELSIARTQGQPKEVVEALQRKVDDINEQRVATMRRLKMIR